MRQRFSLSRSVRDRGYRRPESAFIAARHKSKERDALRAGGRCVRFCVAAGSAFRGPFVSRLVGEKSERALDWLDGSTEPEVGCLTRTAKSVRG